MSWRGRVALTILRCVGCNGKERERERGNEYSLLSSSMLNFTRKSECNQRRTTTDNAEKTWLSADRSVAMLAFCRAFSCDRSNSRMPSNAFSTLDSEAIGH
jgi:hypothetical protein